MQLATDRLILREFLEEDWQVVLAYQSEPLYLRYYSWEARTEEDARGFVRMFLDQQDDKPRRKFQFAVTLRENNRLIGNCGIRMIDTDLRIANIGYELDRRYWGNGYATEAAREMLRLGFETLEMHRIIADCVAENAASAHVLERIGMRKEIHMRENAFFKNRWWDSLQYAILNRDWRADEAIKKASPISSL